MGVIQPGAGRGRGRLGELLRARGLVSEQQIAEAVDCAQRRGTRLGSALVELGHADVDQISDALARQHGVVACRDDDLRVIATPVASMVPAAVARSLCVVPVRVVGGHTLVIAMRDPGDEAAVTELWRRTGLSIRPVVAAQDALVHAIDHLYGPPGEAPVLPPPVPDTPPPRPMRARSSSHAGQGPLAAPRPVPALAARARKRWPMLAVALGVAVAGIAVLRGGGPAAPEPVASAFESSGRGLRAEFGSGWRRLRDASRPVSRLGTPAASEVLIRGGADDPTEILALVRVPDTALPVERWMVEIAEGGLPLRSWWHCSGGAMAGCMSTFQCQASADVHEGGAVCSGEALRDGASYPVTAWIWPSAGRGLSMLVWAPRSATPIAPDHAIAIARSIELR